MNNLETIKNIVLFLASATVFVTGLIIIIKIFGVNQQIKKLNKNIELKQKELDQKILDNIGFSMNIDLSGEEEKYIKTLEQDIKRLQREKKYLLEKISIFKIFNK